MDYLGSGFQIRAGTTCFVVVSPHSCSSGSVFVMNARLCGWLGVTRLSQLGLSDLFGTRDLSVPLVEKGELKQAWQVGG